MIGIKLENGDIVQIDTDDPKAAVQAGRLIEMKQKRAAAGLGDVAVDAGKGAVAGVAQGATDTLGLPAKVEGFGRAVATGGSDPQFQKEKDAAAGDEGWFSGYAKGVKSFTDLWNRQDTTLPQGQDIRDAAEKVTDSPVVSGNYEPYTRTGQIAKAGTAAGTQALMTPGMGGVGNAVKYGAVPGMASETAGIATEGSSWEPAARLTAGLVTGAGVGAVDAYRGGKSILARDMLDGLAPDDAKAALDLMRKHEGLGQPITFPEAVNTVTGGRVNMSRAERVLSGTPGGAAVANDFYAGRNQDFTKQFRQLADDVRGPGKDLDPQKAANLVQEAARKAQDAPRLRANAATEDLYRTADKLPVDLAQHMYDDPIVKEALDRVLTRAGRRRIPETADLQDASLWNKVQQELDIMKRQAQRAGVQMGNKTEPGAIGDARQMVNEFITSSSPDLERAGKTGSVARRIMDQRSARPVGQLGELRESFEPPVPMKQVYDKFGETVMPEAGDNYQPKGGARYARELTARTSTYEPEAVRKIMGDILESPLDAKQAVQNPLAPTAPAAVAARLAGNPEVRQTVRQALEGLKLPDAVNGFDRLMNWGRVMGMREGAGSQTAFSGSDLKRFSETTGALNPASLPKDIATLGKSRLDDYRLRTNSRDFMQKFLTPDGAAQLVKLSRIQPGTPEFAAAAAALLNASTDD